MDSKISSPLVPERTTVAVTPWLIAAIAFAAVFVLLGLLVSHTAVGAQPVFAAVPVPDVPLVNALRFPVDPTVLALVAVVFVWIVLLRRAWSARLLFSAAVIFTVVLVIGDAAAVLFVHADGAKKYPSLITAYACAGYGPWLLMADRSRRPWGVLLCLVALCWGIAYSLIADGEGVADVAGAVCYAGALISLGAYVAELRGIAVFRRANADADA